MLNLKAIDSILPINHLGFSDRLHWIFLIMKPHGWVDIPTLSVISVIAVLVVHPFLHSMGEHQ